MPPATTVTTQGPSGALDPLVVDFTTLDADGLRLAGGKAVNLGVLTRAGLPVPPGVCVTTEAYRRVAANAAHQDCAVTGGNAASPSESVNASRPKAGLVQKCWF